MENQEQGTVQGKTNNFLLYVTLAVVSIFSIVILLNYFTAVPKNQDINKVVSSDMKVRMQPITNSSLSTEKIAVISVVGVIGYPQLTEKVTAELRSASQNAAVKAVILRVESPGGGVHDTDLIHREVLKFKESKKPLIAFFTGVAASGGYYISAPADKIMATPSTITGSIGVIAQFPNYTDLMAKLGVKMHTIKSGPQKDMLSPYRPLDPEGEKILQNWINESYDEFVRVVSNGRKLDESVVRTIADGRIYTARQAVKNKLIDSVGYFEDAVALAKELAKSPDASIVEMNAVDTRTSMFMERFMTRLLRSRNPIEKLILPSGIYYIAPELSQKYLN